jgi:hypothetical protein
MSKTIDPKEFRDLGFVHEINRRLLHPAGLAMFTEFDDDGNAIRLGVFDYRDDPEGVNFGPDTLHPEKAASVDALIAAKAETRKAALGYVVQPVDDSELVEQLPGETKEQLIRRVRGEFDLVFASTLGEEES